jgi:NADPH-dependent glutamate synthase beta subunit-like oxidoreductase
MATSKEEMQQGHNYRRYEEGDFVQDDWQAEIFDASWTHKCPTYIQRTPPCQGSCPAGEDIRGWLDIVRGIEKPSGEMSMQEYAFLRATDANPFPSMMGRVCPAPCQDGCNRNNVEDYVGINAVEQFIGDTAIENGFKYTAGADTGKKVAIIGGGPAGMTAAYQLRRMGHGATVFEERAELGGMMRYGIPGYRIPRDKLAAENQRILDLGVETRMNTRVGRDVSLADVEKEFDAVVWALGCWTGRGLPVDGWDNTPNCVDALSFLEAFNNGRMKVTGKKLVCIGGGDTSIDVVSVARRIGFNADAGLPEDILNNDIVQDQALADAAVQCDATLTSLFTKDKMMAAEHEITDALKEGVSIFDGVMPLEVIVGDDGRATGLKVCDCTMDGMKPVPTEGTERVIEADIIVAAIGQGGDMAGLEGMANERNMIDADKNYQVPDKPGHFVAGDIVRPHLLTTAIGQASIAAESINSYLMSEKMARRPKVDKHHFSLSDKLHEAGLDPDEYDKSSTLGTSEENFAVHNFDDRSQHEIINYDELFLGHFEYEERYKRDEDVPAADEVLGHFHERMIGLTEETAVKEATRCMSCGMCFECDNCVIFCPQDAVFRVKKDQSTMGRYVATDYSKCIGCHICADVCPTGYIDMGMGE